MQQIWGAVAGAGGSSPLLQDADFTQPDSAYPL